MFISSISFVSDLQRKTTLQFLVAMRKIYLCFLVLVVSFIINTYMYSFNSKNSYYILSVNDDVDWEITVKILTGSNRPRMADAGKTVSLFKPVQIYRSNFGLKVNLFIYGKINIKIVDNTGMPVYLRQFTPDGVNTKVEINTSGWNSGSYTITLSDAAGTNIAVGEFDIR